MSSVSGLFTGNSTYSSDFVQVIDRAVQIASLPIDQLNTQKTLLSDEKTALSGLASAFSSLESAVSSLNTSIDTGRYSVSYSDNTVAIASASSGTLPGTYTVQIVDTGTQARANSTATVSDPLKSSISTGTDFTLTVNGKVYSNIKPATNTLNSLAEAINSVTKSDVQATVVNVGTSASPSYQLSIQNSKYGTATITLDDGSGNVLGTPTSGAPVQYRINGQPSGSPLTSDSRTLTISPNLTVTALKTGTTDVVISQTTSNLASALNSFVSAYNGITTALDAQRGDKKGALAGQSIVNTLSQMMRQISGYSRTGSIGSITDIGLTSHGWCLCPIGPVQFCGVCRNPISCW